MMKANFYLSPIDHPLHTAVIPQPMRLLSLFEHPDVGQNDLDWLKDNAAIVLDGEVIPPEMWQYVTIKPRDRGELNIVVVPKGKKVFAILAVVAAVALTAGIASFGVPFLGAAFAAGSLGANVVAAGIGVAASLAVNALTAPPKVGNNGEDKPLVNAGVSGNTATLLDVLPGIIGEVGTSPPFLMPPYTTWDGEDIYVNAAVGVEGRCTVTDIRLNGIPISDFSGATYEIKEGYAGESDRTMFLQTVIEERDNVTLSSFKTDLISTKNDLLSNQTTPDASSPEWHVFRSSGNWSELVFRFMFPAGIVYTSSSTAACVVLEMEIRKVGDVSWRRLPVFYISDQRAGSGPMRCEVRVKREKLSAGRHYTYAGSEYPIFGIDNEMAKGETFTRLADNYFGTGDSTPTDILPVMTAPTTSGVTFSASTEKAGANAAWKARDGSSTTTYWSPNNNTLPGAWLKIDLGSAQTVHSYQFAHDNASAPDAPTTAPTAWQLAGSNDNSTWTDIDDPIYLGDSAHAFDTFQIFAQASYRYYRWTFTANNGAANTELRLGHIELYTTDDPGTSLVAFGSYDAGRQIMRIGAGASSSILCQYATLDEKGAILYLDPAQWDAGEYEIRVRRGWAFRYSLFNMPAQEYDGATSKGYFLDYQLVSGKYKIYAGQKNYRSDMTVECFQTIDTESPFDDSGIAMITLSVPNVQIGSIYAKFKKYASIYSGGIWQAEKVPTSNVAAHYRDLLLGEGHADPVAGEVIDEDGLADWYAKGYNVNAVLQGVRVNEVKQIIAAAGYASPRDSRVYGVIEDADTSSDTIRYLITPHNSKDEGNISEIRRLPHAIRAEFNNAALSYAVDHVFVYRDGYNSGNATLFETINYTGITDETEVIARATFDLRQSYLRQARYSREVGLEFLGIQRGDVVGLSDDTIDGNTAGGWIKSVQYSGGNIVSVTLDNIMPWSLSSSLESAEDVSSITDIVSLGEPMALAIKIPGQDLVYKEVSTVTDDNVCTFATPFADDGSIVPNLLAVCGTLSRPVRRCRVLQVIPRGYERRLIILTDEAPELYA